MAGTIKQQLQSKQPSQRFTRTQRVANQQEYQRNVAIAQDLQELKNKSDAEMQTSTPENYSEKYNQLDERVRQYYLSPNEYFALPEVKQYQVDKRKYDDAIEDQKDYEIARKYSNYAKMRTVSDFYMIVSFKEKATPRQLKYYNQIVAKDKALAEYYSPENVKARAEVKITPINQVELIAVGQSVQLPSGKPVLVKNVGESDASYNYRLAQLGKSTAITQPIATQQKLNYDRNVEYFGEIQKQQEVDAKTKEVKMQYGIGEYQYLPLPSANQFKPKPSGEAPRIIPKFSTIIAPIKNAIPNNIYFNANILMPISTVPMSKKSFNYTAFGEETLKLSGEKQDSIGIESIGKEKYETTKKELQLKQDTEFQTSFENLYSSQITSGKLTQEEAIAKFEKTGQYEKLVSKYENEWQTFEPKLLAQRSKTKKAIAFVKSTPFALTDLTMQATKSPTALAVTGVGIYTFAKFPLLGKLALGTTGVYGGYKFISPKSTFKEQTAGGVMALIAGATLGISAYKWSKGYTPVDKVIPKPKLKVTKLYAKKFGTDFQPEISQENGIVQQSVAFPKTYKLSTADGFLREWYSNPKAFANKYGFKFKPTYSGIPKATPKFSSSTYDFGVFKYTTKPTLTGQEKVYSWLLKQGISPKLATQYMKYEPPTYALLETKGVLQVKYGDGIRPTAKAVISTTKYQPKILVDEARGIYTKPGKTIYSEYSIKKTLLGTTKSGNEIIKQQILREGTLTTKRFTTITEVKQGKMFERPLQLSLTDKSKIPVEVLKKYRISQELYGRSLTGEWKKTDLLYKGLKNKVYFTKDNTLLIKYSGEPKIMKEFRLLNKPEPYIERTPVKVKTFQDLSQKELLAKFKNIAKMYSQIDKMKNANQFSIKNKPSQIKFTEEQAKQITETVKDIYGIKKQTKLQQLKFDLSKYFTQDSQITNYQLPKEIESLKLINLPKTKAFTTVSQTKITLPITKDLNALSSALLMKQSSAQKQLKLSALKNDMAMKQEQIMKEDVSMKQDEAFKLDNAYKLSSALKVTTVTTPIFNMPQPTKPKEPIQPKIPTIPFVFGFELPAGKEKLKERLKKKNIESFALFPDFSSRMIGLKPKEYNEKQLEKEAMVLQTGFEIRRGGAVKISKGRPKKSDLEAIKKLKIVKDMDYLKKAVKNTIKVKW